MTQNITAQLPQTTTDSTSNSTRPILAANPLNKSLFEVIDEVAKEEFESPRQNDASDLEGRVTPPSTSSEPARVNRFLDFGNSSDDEPCNYDSSPERSDEFNTSDGYSPEKQAPKTPENDKTVKSLSRIIEANDPGYDLSPSSKAEFKSALKQVNEWESPHKGKNIVRKLFADTLENTGSVAKISAGDASVILFAAKNTDTVRGGWSLELSRSLNVSFLDVNHLEDLEKNGGFHICSATHPRDRFVISRRTNVLTGVWCGQVCAEKDSTKVLKKFTSFIPREMSLEQYQKLIADAKEKETKIVQQNNRCLYRVTDEKNSFVVECYFQEGGAIIKSAIPVFHYEVYNGKDKSFKIEYTHKQSLSDNDPLTNVSHEVFYDQFFERLKTRPNAVVYDTDDKIVVDVGVLYNPAHPQYGSCPIDQGLLVEVSKDLLKRQ
ncbi:MAG TPA: hypothetical protein VFU89_07615 [Rhabdochlamydiaceae bacterium]|nr:hypothetical protein [Rhabdochlamydiaceae bacterium]